MLTVRDARDLDRVQDPEVRSLIDRRVEDLSEYVDHFSELVFFVIVESGDSIAAVDSALGFAVLANRFDGTAYGEPDFTPSWDVLEEHVGCYEMVFVLSDDGSGVTLFILKADGVPSQLIDLCATFVTEVKEGHDT